MLTPALIAKEISRDLGYGVSQRTVERIAAVLLEGAGFWHVIDVADDVVPVVAAVLERFFEEEWIDTNGDRIELTLRGRRMIQDYWSPSRVWDYTCDRCEGRGVDLERLPEDRVRQFKAILRERPESVIEYDQGYVTPTSTLARFAFAQERGDIDEKDVLVLGDDDLVSLAIAILGQPRSVVVLELDSRLLHFIGDWSERLGLDIKVEAVNLAEPIEQAYHHRFDTFLTDPPESMTAIRAFVGRGIAALKGAYCSGYFGLTHREATLEKWMSIQAYLVEHHVVITDILRNFHIYENWDYIEATRAWRLAPIKRRPVEPWYRSCLYRFVTLAGFHGEESAVFDANTFNDDEATTL